MATREPMKDDLTNGEKISRMFWGEIWSSCVYIGRVVSQNREWEDGQDEGIWEMTKIGKNLNSIIQLFCFLLEKKEIT